MTEKFVTQKPPHRSTLLLRIRPNTRVGADTCQPPQKVNNGSGSQSGPNRTQEEVDHEEDRSQPHKRVNVTSLAQGDLNDRVGDEANTDTHLDRVGEGHEGDGQEAEDCVLRILPINLENLSHHEETNEDQSGRGGLGRNKLNQG